MFGFKKF